MTNHDDERDERSDEERPRRDESRDRRAPPRERPDPWDLDGEKSGTFRIPRI